MNYEEKYKDALERAKDMLSYKEVRQEDMEYLFPELKESEDEMIRKELKRAIAVALDYSYFDKVTADNCIAWLEKQCEQKPCSEEDERIRKGLIENFKWFCGDFPETTKWGKDDDMLVKDIITWLEKQGKKTHQTPQWMINFLNENRCRFASSMDDYDKQREAEGKLDAIIAWQNVRERAAIAAMQGTMSILGSSDRMAFRDIVVEGFRGDKKTYPNEIAEFAVACADALIEELKKK